MDTPDENLDMGTAVEFAGVRDTTTNQKFGGGLRNTADKFVEALKVFDDAIDLKDWKVKKEIKGDKCYNKTFPSGKVYTLTKEFPIDLQSLFDNHWNEIEKTPEWNQNVQSVKRLEVISPNADILHYATSDVVVVKGRDFVVCRMWRKIDDVIYVVASSFDVDIPVLPGKKRGWANFCAGKFRQKKDDANTTLVTYLVSVDLKDKLTPKMVLSSGIAEMCIKDARYAYKYIEEEKKKQGATDS